MADRVLSADEELQAREDAYGRALDRFQAAKAKVEAIPESYRQSSEAAALKDDLSRAQDAAQRAYEYLQSGEQQHPSNQAAAIYLEAEGLEPPQLSAWQWYKQNPNLLEAVPKTDAERKAGLRQDFILRRVQEAAGKSEGTPFSWSNASGEDIRQLAESARRYAEDAVGQQQMASPYLYEPYSLTDETGEPLPLVRTSGYPDLTSLSTGSPRADRVLYNMARPGLAVYRGLDRWKNNFLAGGAALSEGRIGDAAKSFAYAIPNLVSPAFEVGGEDRPQDWRTYMTPEEAGWTEFALDLPFWLEGRNAFLRRPGKSLAPLGSSPRSRIQDELLRPLQRRAAKRHHPDVGGSEEMMRRVNEAFDRGDIDALRRLAD